MSNMGYFDLVADRSETENINSMGMFLEERSMDNLAGFISLN
jgi:hypothetical protein